MRTFFAGAILSGLLFTPVPGMTAQCGDSGTFTILLIPLHPQETDAWCWAAAAQMVMEYQDIEERHRTRLQVQCDLVSDVFRGDLTAYTIGGSPSPFHTCCTRPKIDVCYKAWYVQEPLKVMGFGYKWKPPSPTLLWSDLTQQLCINRPFIATMDEYGDGFHVYVVDGYLRLSFGSTDWKIVIIYDPFLGYRIRTFDMFLDDPGWEKHDGSYMDILPFPNP